VTGCVLKVVCAFKPSTLNPQPETRDGFFHVKR
jgi:hypothetical protein